ncbi:MAG: ArgE/DapE family deacylase [Bacilli bacterium]
MIDLKKVFELHKEEYLNCLKELVSKDTQDLGHGIDGGREKNGQEYMVKLFKEMEATQIIEDPMSEVAIQNIYDNYHEGNLGHNQKDRYNVYATFKGNPKGRSLLFNGHVDVMPPGDENKWTVPPFNPTIKDGKIYGRGVADMKSGLMASVMAIKLLQDAGIELPGDVTITSVCDEEGGGNGSMQAIYSGQRADGVVVCEPTSDQLVIAHMGFVFLKVKVEGLAIHSGKKAEGVSAIRKAMKLIEAMDEVEYHWLLTKRHRYLPGPSYNVGTIHGGTAGSTVADSCYFETCIHYIPNLMSHDQVVNEFTDAIMRVSKSDIWLKEHLPIIEEYQAGGGFAAELDSSFMKAFDKSYAKVLGKKVEKVGSFCGCDSRLWQNVAKCHTLQFGPGEVEQCHVIDEHVEIQSYYEAILIYAELILEWCK